MYHAGAVLLTSVRKSCFMLSATPLITISSIAHVRHVGVSDISGGGLCAAAVANPVVAASDTAAAGRHGWYCRALAAHAQRLKQLDDNLLGRKWVWLWGGAGNGGGWVGVASVATQW
jgi:hypothetical protein